MIVIRHDGEVIKEHSFLREKSVCQMAEPTAGTHPERDSPAAPRGAREVS